MDWRLFLISLAAFGIALFGLAIGALFGNRCLRGSCGGVGRSLGDNNDVGCEFCTTPPEECPRRSSGGDANPTPETKLSSMS